MIVDKANELIGKPYDLDSYNCYHLVRELVPEAPTPQEILKYAVHFRNTGEILKPNLIEIVEENRQDGNIVFLGSMVNEAPHAGVVVLNYIVHADRPSVKASSLEAISQIYNERRYYRCLK